LTGGRKRITKGRLNARKTDDRTTIEGNPFRKERKKK
jgi:hypothetical protein